MRTRAALFSAILALLGFAAITRAETPAVGAQPAVPAAQPIRAVIELFTSQGCSSCPPADKLLQIYAGDPSVIALSLPVDYWDYLGWKDTFASPRNSERQRNYAKARGDGAIYTPQAIINGAAHVNGAEKSEIEGAITEGAKSAHLQQVPIRFWQEDNKMNIFISPAPAGTTPREATVWLGLIQSAGTVDIKQGENAGQQLTYSKIVRELTPIGLWTGQQLMIQIPRVAMMSAETQKSVVLVQEGRSGPIIGAAWAGLF